jgi:hypothetical protein
LSTTLSQALSDKGDIVAVSEKKVYKDSLLMIDLASNSLVKMPFTIHDALQSKPVIKRARPNAYLIGQKEKQAIFCLKTLGLQVDSLTEANTIEVETYQLNQTNQEEAQGEDEESGTASSSGKTTNITQLFEKGTYVVYLNQQKGNLAAEVLEPENPNGFVSLRVINGLNGQELPIYRYIKTTPLK